MKELKIGDVVQVQGSIEHIVISKGGTSYSVRFADNINGVVNLPAYRVWPIENKEIREGRIL